MSEKEFIDYIWDYGCHMIHVFGNDRIEKTCHPLDGECVGLIEFEINGVKSTAKQCAAIITQHKRNRKLEKI